MPHVHILLAKGRTAEQKEKASKELAQVIVDTLGARPEAVTVVYDEFEWGNVYVDPLNARAEA